MKHRWMILVPALCLALAGTAPLAPARADCATQCREVCSGPRMSSSEQAACASRVRQCQQDCYQRAQTAYGAIAYGTQSTARGFANGRGSAGEAEQAALGLCRQYGNDCEIVASFSNACAALAALQKKGVHAVAQSNSRGQAEKDAMSACSRQYGGGCRMETSTCSLP